MKFYSRFVPILSLMLFLLGLAFAGSGGCGQQKVNTYPKPYPRVSITDYTSSEGNSGSKIYTFVVTIDDDMSVTGVISVDVSTANGTAVAGTDYQTKTETLIFSDIVHSQTFSVTVYGNTTYEPDKYFYVNVSNPQNATIIRNQANGTITNDDTGLWINNVSQTEGSGGGTTVFTFTVSASPAPQIAVTVNYATAPDTATVGSDYATKTGSLLFAVDETYKTLTVNVVADDLAEGDERFFVVLSGAVNSTIVDNTGNGTIVDDDIGDNGAENSWPGTVIAPTQNPVYGSDPTGNPITWLNTNRGTSWTPAGTSQRYDITDDDYYYIDSNGNHGVESIIQINSRQEIILFDFDTTPLQGKIITGAKFHFLPVCREYSPTYGPSYPFMRVGVSTVANGPWDQGNGTSTTGQPCYNQLALNQKDWAFTDSTIRDAIFGNGHSIWFFSEASTCPGAPRPYQEDYFQWLAIDPRIVKARIAGISSAFALWDDVGHEWSDGGTFRWGSPRTPVSESAPNRQIFSKEAKYWNGTVIDGTNEFPSGSGRYPDWRPYLEIWTNGNDTTAPNAVVHTRVETADFPAGEALLRWIVPADNGGGSGVIGFKITYQISGEPTVYDFPRWMIPTADAAGTECRMHISSDLALDPGEHLIISIRAVDGAGNISAPFTRQAWVSISQKAATIEPLPMGIAPFPLVTGNPPAVGGVRVSVIDILDKVNPVTGQMNPAQPNGYLRGNHLFSAATSTVRLFGGKNEFVGFQLLLNGTSSNIQIAYSFPGSPNITTELSEFGYVNCDGIAYPDPLVPVSGGVVRIPTLAGEYNVSGQVWHSVICEAYIPHTETAGLKTGSISVTVGGTTLTYTVNLTVWDFTLPNKLSFIPEMNSYQLTTFPPAWNKLAHRHRVCLTNVPYQHSTCISSGYPLYDDGTATYNRNNGTSNKPNTYNSTTETFDWTDFDTEVGPLLDGSLFSNAAETPRVNEPVDAYYTPFNQSWPMMACGQAIYSYGLNASPPTTSQFNFAYWADEGAYSSWFIERQQGAYRDWANHAKANGWTDTLFYFYLNGKAYFRADYGRRNISPWIFDEPTRTQDFWALRWFGLNFHEAVDPVRDDVKMCFRADVSYTENSRNIFWGALDLEVIGGANPAKLRMKRNEEIQWGHRRKSRYYQYGSSNPIDEQNNQPAAWSLRCFVDGACGVLPWLTIGSWADWTTADESNGGYNQTTVFYPADSGTNPAEARPSVRLKSYTRGQQDIEYLMLWMTHQNLPRYAVNNAVWTVVNLNSNFEQTSGADAGTKTFDYTTLEDLWELRTRIGFMINDMHPAYQRSLYDWSIPDVDFNCLPNIGHTSEAPLVWPAKPAGSSYGGTPYQ